ncbi:hypothetical protein [Neptunomonas sp.]|uniref:hypothetical protein n=1 Tax=Neptunomonas sp. TaxID=1971898 RepID=UPI00356AD304
MSTHNYGPNGGALPTRPDDKIGPENAPVRLLNPENDGDVFVLVLYNSAMMKKHARKKRRQHSKQIIDREYSV